jgi:hypothetical protein
MGSGNPGCSRMDAERLELLVKGTEGGTSRLHDAGL